MKVVVATDSLKGSLTSLQAGAAIQEGILRAMSNAEVCVFPMADGGEGTVEALTAGMGGSFEVVTVTNPLGEPVKCTYGILKERRTAVLEIAGAAGLTLVSPQERDPLLATTYGVGEVIKDAIAKGCRHFIIGLGGSATNDGGVGMLQALGFGMLNAEGEQVARGAQGLKELVRITDAHVLPELKECSFRIACDVNNPLCGKEGASAIYGPQKGATPDMVRQMDAWLSSFAELAAKTYPAADATRAGAGAAGGLGFAFLTFLNTSLESGVDLVLRETGLAEAIRSADFVVTGEGRLDGQTAMGKAPLGVARLAKQFGKPVIAFAGSVAEGAHAVGGGFDAYFPILREIIPLEEAMSRSVAESNLAGTAEQVFRLIDRIQHMG